MPDGSTLTRPEHSPLGASSAERWMKCPGSIALIQHVGPGEESEYAEEGTQAHSLAAHCLAKGIQEAWEGMDAVPAATFETAQAVQLYLDYMAPQPIERLYVEFDVQHPAFHPRMYGRLDAAVFEPEEGIALEIVDYKHGVGVAVDVEGNAQERYYAFAFIAGTDWPTNRPRLADNDKIKLTIVQPRGFHPDGAIRSEIVTAGELRQWAYDELRPAMQQAGEHRFSLGEHCRFCPAKLVCPAMRHLATDAAFVAGELMKPEQFDIANTDDEWLGFWYSKLSLLDMMKKVIREETDRRVKSGRHVPGAKLVYGKVDRVWKEAATDPDFGALVTAFGDAAWKPRALRSPAEIEGVPGGKEFVAEYAMKPPAGLTIAPLADKRAAQKPQTSEEVFAGVQNTA